MNTKGKKKKRRVPFASKGFSLKFCFKSESLNTLSFLWKIEKDDLICSVHIYIFIVTAINISRYHFGPWDKSHFLPKNTETISHLLVNSLIFWKLLHRYDKIHFSLPDLCMCYEVCIWFSFYGLYLSSERKKTLDVICGKFSEFENGIGIYSLFSQGARLDVLSCTYTE